MTKIKEFQALIYIHAWIGVGWGNQYQGEVLKVKKGEIPPLSAIEKDAPYSMQFTMGQTVSLSNN